MKQKYRKGDIVHIAKDPGDTMEHYEITQGTSDRDAVVLYSCKDRHGGGEREKHIYGLYVKGQGETAWYNSDQLTLIKKTKMPRTNRKFYEKILSEV